jgi:type II secretory pathway component PulM
MVLLQSLGMREHDDTDQSGTTAQFRAFVAQPGPADVSAPWAMRAPRNRVAVLAGAVIVVAVLLVLISLLVIG